MPPWEWKQLEQAYHWRWRALASLATTPESSGKLKPVVSALHHQYRK